MSIMELDDFFMYMSQLREKNYEPYFELGNNVASSTKRKSILFRHPKYPGLIFCPLTAVCHVITGTYCRTSEYRLAARTMKMRFSEDASIIQLATDGCREYEMRTRLLKALGLTEHS